MGFAHGIFGEGRHYDLLPGRDTPDLAFYRRAVARFGEPVLELACGTGRLTLPLAAAKVRILGLDNAIAMLLWARHKARERGLGVPLIAADARRFALRQSFRLILMPYNAFAHLLHRGDAADMLACVRRQLAPEGRFILDVAMPSAEILARDPARRVAVGAYEDPDGGELVTVEESTRYDPVTQVRNVVWHYRTRDGAGWDVPIPLRMYFPEELLALLQGNGFAVEERCGDFDAGPLTSESRLQLLTCRAA